VSALDELHPALSYHLVNTLGWTELRPTQIAAIKPAQSGDNILLLAPTAGGKTEAAVFPLLSRMAAEGWRGLSALYVCPLRALLNNIEPRLQQYASFVGRRAALWHGDVGDAARRHIVNDPPDLLLTTPESLEAIMISPRVNVTTLLGDVRAVVVDELHAFAGDDRGWHLLFLLGRIEHLGRRQLQRIGLTATVGNPEEMLVWLARGRGGRVVGASQPSTDGEVTADYVGSLRNSITVLARVFRGERRLVFAESRSRVERITEGCRAAGIRTFASHASLSADERRAAEAAFAAEPDCAIVATSTLELGIDVGDLDRVVQIGAPANVTSFLQRMGRTGRRAGAQRNCLFLATDDEELLTALAVATLWRDGVVDPVTPPARPAHIYAQQVMALALQLGGVARPDLDAWLGPVASEVPEDDRGAVVRHMLEVAVLAEDGGVLGLGERGEREFGRRHFGDLVAAFSSPLMLTVHHGAAELGTVHPASLARSRGDAAPVLLLGGRSWQVVEVDWPRRRVSVVRAKGGGRSRWLGGGRALSARVCHAAERIVAGATPGCALSRRAEAKLAEVRERLAFVDGRSLPIVADGDNQVRVWAFAGGLASASLECALARSGLASTRWDDFSISVRATSTDPVARAIAKINLADASPRLPPNIAAALKFSSCLPNSIAAAVLQARTAVPDAIAEVLCRPIRQIHA
jgi:ATP-dependent helicase Lhr and Lhr-like helicase